jgi:Cof subfamily protein (haloacid dehalogenase superfamily)
MVRAMSAHIRLVVSDVDGTLVRHDKTLHPETIAAVRELRAAGVLFALVSSRPPTGLNVLVDPLGLDTPRAGFNGGRILAPAPDDRTLVERTIPEAACVQAVATMLERGVDPWLFADGQWYLLNPHAHYIPRERLSISQDFVQVADLMPYCGRAHKLMGSAEDFDVMARLEAELAASLSGQATVLRSQNYYLDVTHPEANKGFAALSLARLLGVEPAEMCCLGDMPNDTPMFAVAGMSIAMGNSPEPVKALAQHVTGDNEGTGWADAVRRLVLA